MTVGAALLLYAIVLGRRAARPAPRRLARPRAATRRHGPAGRVVVGGHRAVPGRDHDRDAGHGTLERAQRPARCCILRLRAAYATPGGAAVAGAGITLSATIAIRTGWAMFSGYRTRRAELLRQRTLIALCGTIPTSSDPSPRSCSTSDSRPSTAWVDATDSRPHRGAGRPAVRSAAGGGAGTRTRSPRRRSPPRPGRGLGRCSVLPELPLGTNRRARRPLVVGDARR